MKRTYPDTVWIVFDLDNGAGLSGETPRAYAWWFQTRKLAMSHRRWQKKQKFAASLSMPVKYRRMK